MKKAVIVFGSLVVLFAVLLTAQLVQSHKGNDASSDTDGNGREYYYNKNSEDSDTDSNQKSKEKMIKVDTKPDSITVLVNRKYLMPKTYVPADLVIPNIPFSFYGKLEKSYVRQVTAQALEKLFAAGKKQGVVLKGVSGYRSYARQTAIYNNNVITRGEKSTNQVSAKPGSSEHQTGLSIDVSADSVGCSIDATFGKCREGKWLAKNGHKYGFIIRYPKDKTNITGYDYEPWHIRFVGVKLATYLYEKNLCLEEYYKLTPAKDKIEQNLPKINDTIGTDDGKEPEMKTAPTPYPTKKPVATKKPKKKKKKVVKHTAKPKVTQKPVVTQTPETPAPVVTEAPAPTQAPPADDAGTATTDGAQ